MSCGQKWQEWLVRGVSPSQSWAHEWWGHGLSGHGPGQWTSSWTSGRLERKPKVHPFLQRRVAQLQKPLMERRQPSQSCLVRWRGKATPQTKGSCQRRKRSDADNEGNVEQHDRQSRKVPQLPCDVEEQQAEDCWNYFAKDGILVSAHQRKVRFAVNVQRAAVIFLLTDHGRPGKCERMKCSDVQEMLTLGNDYIVARDHKTLKPFGTLANY